jgi:hypothetical protein
VTEHEYGHADMSTWRLKRYYQRWQRKAWRQARLSPSETRPGPAGSWEKGAAHYAKCRKEVLWAAANLKRRGWFIG